MFIYSLNISLFFENEMLFFYCMKYTLSLKMFTSLQFLLQISCSRYSAQLSTMELSLCRIFFSIHSIQSIVITSPQQSCSLSLNLCHSFKKEHLQCKTIQDYYWTSERPHGASETLTWRSHQDKYSENFLFVFVGVNGQKREKSLSLLIGWDCPQDFYWTYRRSSTQAAIFYA